MQIIIQILPTNLQKTCESWLKEIGSRIKILETNSFIKQALDNNRQSEYKCVYLSTIERGLLHIMFI